MIGAMLAASVAFSFGDVTLDVENRGDWKVELTREVAADGVEIARLRPDCAAEKTPPRTKVSFKISQVDMGYVGSVNGNDRLSSVGNGRKVIGGTRYGNGNGRVFFYVYVVMNVARVLNVIVVRPNRTVNGSLLRFRHRNAFRVGSNGSVGISSRVFAHPESAFGVHVKGNGVTTAVINFVQVKIGKTCFKFYGLRRKVTFN